MSAGDVPGAVCLILAHQVRGPTAGGARRATGRERCLGGRLPVLGTLVRHPARAILHRAMRAAFAAPPWSHPRVSPPEFH